MWQQTTALSLKVPQLNDGLNVALCLERWPHVALLFKKNIQQSELEPSGPEEKAAQQAIRLFGALTADSFLTQCNHFLQHAVDCIPVHIVPSIKHSSPVLRSAALAEIGGATKDILSSLSQPVVRQLMNDALAAALEDPVVAVRSSACRMIGDFVNAGFYLSEKVKPGRATLTARVLIV